MTLPLLSSRLTFPDPRQALREPNGLLAVGGDLRPERLCLAYRQGIFPWFNAGEPPLWWSPDPRAVLWPEAFHCSRNLRRFLRHTNWRITLNHAFSAVIQQCAQRGDEGTWISAEMQQAYCRLHQLGDAHSVEVWQQDTLIGGLYGVSCGALFCGESMFSRQSNASKVALAALCQHGLRAGIRLIDCQVLNPHTASLGAVEIPRQRYLTLLDTLRDQPVSAACWQAQTIAFFC